MGHGPATDWGADKAIASKARVGIILFFIYCIAYGGFVAINTLKPKLMDIEVIAGVNLACVYGFGLIVLAIIMGLIYNALCTKMEDSMNMEDTSEGGDK